MISYGNEMKRWRYVILFAVVAIIAYIFYLTFRVPPGLEPLGGNKEMIAKLGLWSAIAGALASFFSLLKDVIGLFKKSKE